MSSCFLTIRLFSQCILVDVIEITSVAKLEKKYPIWNTQNSNEFCEYKFLLSDCLSLLMNKLCWLQVWSGTHLIESLF